MERLSAYIDGELGAREREVVEAHCIACLACAKELAWLTRLGEVLRAGPQESLDDDLVPGILARLPPRPSVLALVRPRLAPWRPVGAVAMVIALMVVLAAVIWRQGRFQQPPVWSERVPSAAEPYVREHALYAGSQPFADRASLILLTSYGSEGR
jgi:anti-sigma factor RsiW